MENPPETSAIPNVSKSVLYHILYTVPVSHRSLYMNHVPEKHDNRIKIRSLTCSPLLIYHGVGDIGKLQYGPHASDLMSEILTHKDQLECEESS
jgi:hypothetical protein